MEKEISQKYKDFKCSKCGSKFFYLRRKTSDLVCRRCGTITDMGGNI